MATPGPDLSGLSPKSAETYHDLMKDGKDLAAQGMLTEAVEALRKACAICPTKKVRTRIEKLETFIAENAEESENDEEMVEVTPGFFLHNDINKKLFDHQREGVVWMYQLYKKKKGGILGDDMGMGKTFQVIAFLSGMIDADLIKHMLIIMPVSLLPNWKKEFERWCPGIIVYEFHGTSKKQREQNLTRVQRRGGVLLTSYGMVASNFNLLNNLEGRVFIWDYVILDEGHKIKNPTKTTKAVHEIPSKNRIVLTGTPIQNNLRELWALFDFTHHGTLLGSQKTFKTQYELPIYRSREKDSTLGEKKLGTEMAASLKQLISPYFLRRTKDQMSAQLKNCEDNEIEALNQSLQDMQLSTRKNDFIVWLFLSNAQHEIYTSFLESDSVKQILVEKRSPLVELTILKKICDHPRLLSIKACMQLGLNGEMSREELMREIEDERTTASSIENISNETLIEESGKLNFTLQLLEHLKSTGHRTLVFSLSRKILDMIQRILLHRGWKVLRIDGTISKMEERHRRINLFQNDPTYAVFLLTTQVGGVGITLTAADRVVIYDPSWNPATDSQAVDRVYRIGQKKNVVIYRLITCGTVEEKIYRNQIFKDSITRQATQNKDPHRYFSKQELRELFVVEDIYCSKTQMQLNEMHSNERTTDTYLDEHIAYLTSLNIFGISDHNLMFSKDLKDPKEDHDEATVSSDYIKRRVEMAQMMVRTESSVVEEGLRETGTFVKPFTLPIPSVKRQQQQQPDYNKTAPFPEVIDLTQPKYPVNSYSVPRLLKPPETAFKSPPIATYSKVFNNIVINNAVLGHPKTTETILIQDEPLLDFDKTVKKNSSGSSEIVRLSSSGRPKTIESIVIQGDPSLDFNKIEKKNSSRSPEIVRLSSSGMKSRDVPNSKIESISPKSPKHNKPEVTNKKQSLNEKNFLSSPIAPYSPNPEKMTKHLESGDWKHSTMLSPEKIVDLAPENKHILNNEHLQRSSMNPLMRTRLLDDSLGSFDFSDQEKPAARQSRRMSCVNRRSTLLWSETDSSKSNCASADTSKEIVVSDSEESSDSDSSGNSTSSSNESIDNDRRADAVDLVHRTSLESTFAEQENVEESSPSDVNRNKQMIVKNLTTEKNLNSPTTRSNNSPYKGVSSVFSRGVKSGNFESFIIQTNVNSPKRITPLRVDPNMPSPSNSAFEKAISAAKELSPVSRPFNSPKKIPAPLASEKTGSSLKERINPVFEKKKSAGRVIDSKTSEDPSKKLSPLSRRFDVAQNVPSPLTDEKTGSSLNESVSPIIMKKKSTKKVIDSESSRDDNSTSSDDSDYSEKSENDFDTDEKSETEDSEVEQDELELNNIEKEPNLKKKLHKNMKVKPPSKRCSTSNSENEEEISLHSDESHNDSGEICDTQPKKVARKLKQKERSHNSSKDNVTPHSSDASSEDEISGSDTSSDEDEISGSDTSSDESENGSSYTNSDDKNSDNDSNSDEGDSLPKSKK